MNDTPPVTCGKCGSASIVLGARLTDRINELGMQAYEGVQLTVDRKPTALVFKNSEHATLRARVCADCGIVEFYATDAESLYGAYQASLRDHP